MEFTIHLDILLMIANIQNKTTHTHKTTLYYTMYTQTTAVTDTVTLLFVNLVLHYGYSDAHQHTWNDEFSLHIKKRKKKT